MSRRTVALALLAVGLLLASPWPVVAQNGTRPAAASDQRLELRLKPLPSGIRKVSLEAVAGGGCLCVLERDDGSEERVTPDTLTQRLLEEGRRRNVLYRLLNITSTAGIAWVALGLLGQVLFAGRMILQLFVSEREKRSVVPVGFWWMSLAGSAMLVVYFVWRQDIVGVLGQSAGLFVYLRNLRLIQRERQLARSGHQTHGE
jgi:lipid-A-disaccharide synthase-like uncharacterized protein